MIVPPPTPAYTIAPGVVLSPAARDVLERSLAALTGRVQGVVVSAAGTAGGHQVLEMITASGSMLILERLEQPAC